MEEAEEEGPKTRLQAQSKRLRNLWNSVDNGDSQKARGGREGVIQETCEDSSSAEHRERFQDRIHLF